MRATLTGMASPGFSRNLLRPDTDGAEHRVTYIELFFDLVFVFAVTQISHLLLAHPGPEEFLHTLVLTAVVWWVWIYTTWAFTWLNPERGPVRAMLIVMMLLGLLMASAIPEAFGDKDLLFAGALAAMQVGRSAFTLLALARQRPELGLNFLRISLWNAFAAAFWIAGALVPDALRPWIWLLALLVDYGAPYLLYWVPFLGRSDITTWNVAGGHMAERVSLFLIIVLGESIIVSGTSFSEGPLDWTNVIAFLSSFLGTVLLWLLYFSHSERGGSDYIVNAADPGPIARTAYTYVPALMVLGVVLAAVADGLVLADPLEAGSLWTAGLVCGSSAVYVLGNALFRRAAGGRWLAGHFLGILAFGLLTAASPLVPALVLAWAANAVLLLVVVGDEVAWRRAQPSHG
ncbi:low temperature requirement protein A [Cryobacterium breve]|uniref:Low temperature requirement protein A n=1 Tax=Cryobacterium breve TaxID=1259258 RepID=A0ABY7NEX9_9MICO|nr:low temperature requirement protein A [Cryobacterium breve]WBM80799.1 low temperature requirement protein A [Cryobacterium breve]